MEMQISFYSAIENLSFAENFVDEVCDKLSLREKVFGNIKIGIVEAVSNAITHGNKLNENKRVWLSCTGESSKIVFSVTDEGTGFDCSGVPDPTSPENLEKPDGRGIFLMKQLADEVVFSKDGRCVELHFKL